MNPIDPERTKKLLGAMRESVAMLREIAEMPESEFLRDKHRQSSAKYNLVTAIEAAIDLANHSISKSGFRPPNDYADTFAVLSEQGILDRAFAKNLQNMARFRNRLVHIYWDVDIREIWAILQTRLGDFGEYQSALAKHWKQQSR